MSAKVALVVLPLLFSSFVFSRAYGQTKDETKAFLMKKIKDEARAMPHHTFKFEGDAFVKTLDYTNPANKKERNYRSHTIPMKDCNPRRAEVVRFELESGGVVFFVQIYPTDAKSNGFQHKDLVTNEVTKLDRLTLDFSDERLANQVAKAFRHLIPLCGGKAELFDD